MVNYCVSCGREMPEGDHICNSCKQKEYTSRPVIKEDTTKEVPRGCMSAMFGVITVFLLVVFCYLVVAILKIWG